MERADLRAGRHRRGQDLCAKGAARVDHGLAAIHPERGGERPDDVIGDGQDDQLDFVEDRLRVGEDSADLDQRTKPLAPGGIAAGDGMDRPTPACEGDAERRPDRSRPDDPDDRRLPGFRVEVRVAMVARVRLRVMAMGAGSDRVQIDAGRLDGGLLLGPVALRVIAGQVAPGPHG